MAKLAAWIMDRQPDEDAARQPAPRKVERSHIGLEKHLEDFVDADRAEIAHGLPDPLSPVLAMDEEEFPSRWRHPDAEAPEPGVAAFIGGLARNQRPDSGVGEIGYGHVLSPGFGCTGEATVATSVPRLQNGERKNDPFSDG